jgi:hypothetical protein
MAQPVAVHQLPPGSVDAEGKAGKADEDEAEPLRIAEYYRPECHPEYARQQVGQPDSGGPRCRLPHGRKSNRRRPELAGQEIPAPGASRDLVAVRGSVSTVLAIAPAHARGEGLAGLLLAAYVGLAVPVVALGLATQALSTQDAVLGFAVLLAAVVALASRRLLGHAARLGVGGG